MTFLKLTLALGAMTLVTACEDFQFTEQGPDKTIDRGIDQKPLTELVPGIWVDPNGCDHWIIDDGVEGYLSQRLDKFGKPVCSGVAEPTFTTGDFKGGATGLIGDPI